MFILNATFLVDQFSLDLSSICPYSFVYCCLLVYSLVKLKCELAYFYLGVCALL
jgi:hypothetical protein